MLENDTKTRQAIYDLLRRRGIRTDLELSYEDGGTYRYCGQSPLCSSLRTDLRIGREGRRYYILRIGLEQQAVG